jgi:hypothetical protein
MALVAVVAMVLIHWGSTGAMAGAGIASARQSLGSLPGENPAPAAGQAVGASPNDAAAFLSVSPNNLGSNVAVDKSKAWDRIDFSSRRLTNNVWGAPPTETLTSGVYLGEANRFGWYWSRQEPRPKPGMGGVLPIYPSVRVGGSPWDPSNSVYFPAKIGDIRSLQFDVTYDFVTPPTGSFNLAYDVFFSDTNQPGPDPKPKAEMMIWLRHTMSQPANAYRGDFTDGNSAYQLYSWTMPNGRLYYSFVLKEQCPLKAQHTVDARRLMDNLGLDPTWFVHGVELGNEVVDGSGKIEIGDFSVTINGAKS